MNRLGKTDAITFGDFQLDLVEGMLRKRGTAVPLSPKEFETLRLLVEKSPHLVTKDEFIARIWPDTFVGESSLARNISVLRKLISEELIETVAKRGYRFRRPIALVDSGEGTIVPGVAQLGIESRVQGLSHWYLWILAVAALVVAALSLVFWSQKHRAGSIPELRFKQLTLNSNQKPVHSGVISPDGKYLAYTDLDGIHLQLIETDQTRTIARTLATNDSRLWKVVGWLAGSTSFVANLYLPDQNEQSIWLYSILGESPQKLRDHAEAWSTSRDGSLIAFGSKFLRTGPLELWIMDARGEHDEKLVEADLNTSLQDARFSPDGQWLAYVRHVDIEDNTEQILETRSLRLGQTNRIISTRQICDHFWLPDGRLIYGLPERADPSNSNYWTLHMDPHSGRADSSPRRLTNWAGFDLRQVSATSDGRRLVFLASIGVVEEYLADYSPAKQISGTKRLPLDGTNAPLGWTPDSKQIILSTVRNGYLAVFKQSLESGSIEPVVVNMGQHAASPRLSPDGAWILYFAIPDNHGSGPASLMRIPVSGGPSHYVLQSHSSDYRCSLLPASLCLFSERTTDRKQLIWTSFDPLRGVLNELARMDTDADADYDWALSPNAWTIVIRKNREASVDFLDLRNHKFRHVSVEGWNLTTNLDWAPDGKGFFTCGIRPEGATLLYIDLKGKAQPIWEYNGDFLWGMLSPDGQHLAMGAQTEKNNVWMMENF